MNGELLTLSRPPITEVALAVQLEPGTIGALDVSHFHSSVLAKYPKDEHQPARPPMEESFEQPTEGPQFRFEVMAAPPMPRFWFLNDDGSRLVQTQHDLIAVNWRRVADDADYPRYKTLRGELLEHLEAFDELLTAKGKPGLRPNWCEVTYINLIRPPEGGFERLPLERVLRMVRPLPAEGFLPSPEDAQLVQRFIIPGEQRPAGRLTLAVASAINVSDQVPVWSLNLTGRVLATGEGLDSSLSALDVAREWAVSAFEEVTTPEMQSQWGREQRKKT